MLLSIFLQLMKWDVWSLEIKAIIVTIGASKDYLPSSYISHMLKNGV